MKQILIISFLFCAIYVGAQEKNRQRVSPSEIKLEQYFSFNPLGLTEPQMAIGVGFGNRFSPRSEYFSEISYVTRNYYFDNAQSLNGYRLITQYRYHFLQQWKPLIDLGFQGGARRKKHHPFIGVEFRLKSYNFTSSGTFVNYITHDTLSKFNYNASAVSVGGALIFGSTYYISSNHKWLLEFTAGVGGKQKFVNYKNLGKGYEIIQQRKFDFFGPPAINETVGTPYFPSTIRLRYIIY